MRTISFYSFKGGVGRTSLCANLAAFLAKRGANVCIIDWDLRAPGIHEYFRQERGRPGVADLLNEAIGYRSAVAAELQLSTDDGPNWVRAWNILESKIDESKKPQSLLSEALRPWSHGDEDVFTINSSSSKAEIRSGFVRLLSAGSADALRIYSEGEFCDDQAFAAVISAYIIWAIRSMTREVLVLGEKTSTNLFDFIFIDVQAGNAPTSILPRDLLFDSHIVLIGGLNRQNRSGVFQSIERFSSGADKRIVPLDHFPSLVSMVLSPVPDSAFLMGRSLIREYREEITSLLKENPSTRSIEAPPSINLVPYFAPLAIEESLVAVNKSFEGSSYSSAIENIAEHPVFKTKAKIHWSQNLNELEQHPLAALPKWTWMLRGLATRHSERSAIEGALEWDGLMDDSLSIKARSLFDVLWIDFALSDSGFSKLVSGLRDTSMRQRLLFEIGGEVDSDRIQILRTPKESWSELIPEALDAMFRFGDWLYGSLGAGIFTKRFLKSVYSGGQFSAKITAKWGCAAAFWFHLASISSRMEKKGEAIIFSQKALMLSPRNVRLLEKHIQSLCSGGQYSAAQAALSRYSHSESSPVASSLFVRSDIMLLASTFFLDLSLAKSLVRSFKPTDVSALGENLRLDILERLFQAAVLAGELDVFETWRDFAKKIVSESSQTKVFIAHCFLIYLNERKLARILFEKLTASAEHSERGQGFLGIALVQCIEGDKEIDVEDWGNDPHGIWVRAATGKITPDQAKQQWMQLISSKEPHEICGYARFSLGTANYLRGCVLKAQGWSSDDLENVLASIDLDFQRNLVLIKDTIAVGRKVH